MTSREDQLRVGKYAIHEELGAGGFGTVRKARDETTGELVAIKILDKYELCMYEMTQCLRKEIGLLTSLNHPNIVRGKEILNSKTKIFLVMEYIDGGDVHSALNSKRRFSEDEARILFRSLMEALTYCHSKGVYHRDLKLENMLLTTSGQLKVCDFGLASVRDLHNSKKDLCSTVVGTEDFSCPEILQSIPYMGEKADMWSCGIVLFTLLAGHFPFRGSTPGEMAQSVINCKYSFPRNFSREVKELIQSLLVKNPKRRLSASQALESDWLRTDSPRSITSPSSLRSPSSYGALLSGRSSRTSFASYQSTEDERQRTSWKKFHLGAVVPVRISVLRVSRRFGRGRSVSATTELYGEQDRSSFSVFDALGRARIPNFEGILEQMRDKSTGINVQDRKWRLRTFRACFTGQEAVQWICERLSCSVENAVELGQKFHEVGAFHHVCRDHGFKNEHLFYRWIWDDPGYEFVLNARYNFRAVHSPDPEKTVFNALRDLLNVCRFHQQLHDYRQIDMLGLQQDSRFVTFGNSVVQLQSAALHLMENDEQKVCFLVNLYNMLWIHARIQIGDFEEMEFGRRKFIAEGLEYIIGGTKLSLGDVTNLLFFGGGVGARRASTQSEGRKMESLATSFLRSLLHAEHMHDVITPNVVHPLVMFLVSDGSPFSPAIKVVTRNDLSESELRNAAGRYVNKVVEVDLQKRTVRYPVRVGDLRIRLSISDDMQMVDTLTELSVGFEIHSDLEGLREAVRANPHSLVVVEIADNQLPLGRTKFAPDILNDEND